MVARMRSWALLLLLLLLIPEIYETKRPPKQGVKSTKAKSQTAEPERFEDTSLSLEIEHSIGRGSEFFPRGTLHLKSLKTSTGPLTFQQNPLSSSNVTSLRLAARFGGFYFIRTRSKFNDLLSQSGEAGGDGEVDYVTTLISACALVNARLSDLITINGDGQGNVIGLTLSIPVVTTEQDCEDADMVKLPGQFNTSVSLNNGMPPPQSDTESYFLKKDKEEREKREGGGDNRSFLQKYWMYILIGFVVFTFVNNAASAAGGGGGGGGGQ